VILLDHEKVIRGRITVMMPSVDSGAGSVGREAVIAEDGLTFVR